MARIGLVKPRAGGSAVVEWQPGYTDEPPTVEAQVTLAQIAIETTPSAQAQFFMDQLGLSFEALRAEAAAALDAIAMDSTLAARATVDAPQFQTTTFMASMDSWVDDLAVCTGSDNNHDATNLSLDPTVATQKIAYVKFDLSGFPSGATVLAASLTLNVVTRDALPGAGDQISVQEVTGAWNEATVKCSDDPGGVGSAVNFTIGATTGEKVLALSGNPLAAADASMGTADCSFLIRMVTALKTATLQAKDSGGAPGNAFGPRLEFTFTQP